MIDVVVVALFDFWVVCALKYRLVVYSQTHRWCCLNLACSYVFPLLSLSHSLPIDRSYLSFALFSVVVVVFLSTKRNRFPPKDLFLFFLLIRFQCMKKWLKKIKKAKVLQENLLHTVVKRKTIMIHKRRNKLENLKLK